MSNASDLSQHAKAQAAELGAQAKAAVTREAAKGAEQAKHAAAEKVQSAADAADAAASEFDPASPQAQAMQHVAGHIEDIAMKLRAADVRQLADQATDMARRNPLLFIGGAAFVGFSAARFLKARDPRTTPYPRGVDPWATEAARSSTDAPDGSVLSQINGEQTHA